MSSMQKSKPNVDGIIPAKLLGKFRFEWPRSKNRAKVSSLKSKKERAVLPKKIKSSFSTFRPNLSLKEQTMFAKRLSLLVKAGVPLFESVSLLEKQTSGRANKKMFKRIRDDLASGQFLYKSLTRYPKVFGEFTINIIRIGETSGTLYANLRYLADEMDKKRVLRQKVIGALVYPSVIVIAAIAISALMTVFLFPKLLPVFRSLNVPLPLSTKILLAISNILLNYWYLIILGIFAILIVFFLLMRWHPFRYMVHSIFLKFPIIGAMLKHYYLTNICRTLGTLFRSQVRVLEAIEIASDTTTNLIYKDRLQTLRTSITRGGKISSHFEKFPKLFPGMLSHMIAVGETTGSLSETLAYLGEIHEGELDEQTKRLSSVIEPVMMIGVGVMVGFIAVSIITPIYEVTQHLNPGGR